MKYSWARQRAGHNVRTAAFTIAIGSLATFVGLLIAFLPPGVLIRLALPLIALGALGFAWALQSETQWHFTGLLRWFLLALVALSILWPRYLFLHTAGLPGVNPFTAAVMLALVVTLFAVANSRPFARELMGEIRRGGMATAVLLTWMLWRFVASLLGEEPLPSIFELAKETVYVASFLLFGYVLAGWKEGSLYVVRVVVACGFVAASIGVVEAFVQRNPFVGFVSATSEAMAPQALLAIAAEKIRGGAFRAQSTFDHPIVFAQFVAALVPLSLFVLKADPSRFWRLIGLVTIPVALLAIVKSGSRAGYVSVGIAFALVGGIWWLRAILHGRYSRVVAIMALPALVGTLLFAWLFLSDLVVGRNQHEMSSTSVRLTMLKNGIDALWSSPVWGFGHGLSISKAGVVNAFGMATIDNYMLSIALDYGYVGLILFLAGIAAFSTRAFLFAVGRSDANGEFVGACVASVLALVATFAGLSIYQNMTMLWLLVAICAPIIGGRSLMERPERLP